MKLLLLLLLLASSAHAYMIIAYNMNTSQDIQLRFQDCYGVGSNTTVLKRPPSSDAPHMWFSPEIEDVNCVDVVVGTLWARINPSWLPSYHAYTLGMSDTTNPLAMRIETIAITRPQYVCNGPVPNKCTGLGGENPNTQLTSTAPYGTSYDLFIY